MFKIFEKLYINFAILLIFSISCKLDNLFFIFFFKDISHVSCQESNKELCNRIETKLSHLNQIGLNLKKENNGLSKVFFIFVNDFNSFSQY